MRNIRATEGELEAIMAELEELETAMLYRVNDYIIDYLNILEQIKEEL